MRYFLGFLIGIGLVVLIFILILKSFGSKGSTPLPKPLVDYATTNVTAELTVDGPITANQTHQAVQIIVDQSQTQINILQGYQGNVTATKTYANNQDSYGVFLRALDLANFSKGNTDPTLADSRGYCPTGDRYIYKLINNDSTIEDFWATSCGGQGTFKGSIFTVNNLFIQQIPDYNTLTENVQF